ncbi:hypothetical protein BCV70DRAFT_158878 [Testicularia cyperi]|uniref:cystathionine gamma-lyase n=1 Tax=Testicularia cyperi TaxID=1882483 RepID=A0A317XUG0_9BASI|nr:hypothetical protein BCV70DRAFT_158878 [Testicularia cyperi]
MTVLSPVLGNGANTNGHSNSSNGHSSDVYSGFSTKAIHIGSEPNEATGAVIPPISLSSTFAQESIGVHKGYEYSRAGNPNRDSFERALAALEGGSRGLAFSSGSAVTATILNSMPARSHVVSVNDVYGGTYRYFTKVASVSQGIETSFVQMDGAEDEVSERVNAAIQNNTSLVWIETPTNPTLRVIDIALIVKLVRSHPNASKDIKIVVDNTFMSPWFQNPLAQGADLVMHSVTKYLNGHSDVVMGVAVLHDGAWADRLAFLQNAIGATPSPFDCWLALRGLKTLSVRMKAHGASALAIAQFLASHPAVETVIYPGLPSHPGHQVARRQVTKRAAAAATPSADGAFAYGGMISFRLKSDPSDDQPADKLLGKLQVFTLAESLGGVESLIELPSKMTHGSVALEDRIKIGIGHNLIRISVGIEDTSDLIEDLKRGFQAADRTLWARMTTVGKFGAASRVQPRLEKLPLAFCMRPWTAMTLCLQDLCSNLRRVASRVPRLATKSTVTADSGTSSAIPKRSVREAFTTLAGSTYSARSRNHQITASVQAHSAVRTFSTTPMQFDLKDQIKDKAVEKGKEYAKEAINDSGNREEVKRAATRASGSLSKILFAGLAVAGAFYMLSGGTAHNEEDRSQGPPSTAKFTKDQVSLLCLIGPHLSGKSSQAKRLLSRFDKELDGVVQPNSVDELVHMIKDKTKSAKGRRLSLIVEGFPNKLEDAERIEKELVPIFCLSFYDLSLSEFEKRLPKDADHAKEVDQYRKASKFLDPIVKKYRDQGNIYEISADWDSEEEVWEQVEAKTEQILELRDRGDL